jgi:hypothetical protein
MNDYFNVRSFGAKGDGVVNDKAAIQATIDAAVASGGGTVYFSQGTYKCSTALALGNADLFFNFSPGTILDFGALAGDFFTSAFGNTYRFDNARISGDGSAGQVCFHQMAGGGTFRFYSCPDIGSDAGGIETTFKADTGAAIYVDARDTFFSLRANAAARFLTAVDAASCAINFLASSAIDSGFAGFGGISGKTSLRANGSCGFGTIGGLDLSASVQIYGAFFLGGGTITINTDTGDYPILDGCGHDGQLAIAAPQAVVKGCGFYGAIARSIDFIAGADRCAVVGCSFVAATTDLIRSSAQKLRVSGCDLVAAGAVKTIRDAGAGDYTLGVGNIGVSTGGGLALAVNSKVTIGDYNFA